MADISKVKLPNNVTYDIKDNSGTNSDHRHYASDLVPLVHKKYESTSYYNQGTAGWANSSWYFMKVKPDSWYLPWRVKFKVHSYCPAYTSYQSISYCTVTGRANSAACANFNERYDSAHYYTVVYPLKKAGFDAGYEHAIGISILYGGGYTNSAYYRTFEVDYYECENCTVTILDTPIKWADWSGNSTTNYENLVSMNAVDRGLQETGDANTITENRIGYFAGKTSVTHGIWAGSLFMEDANNTYQNICTAADGTATASNRTTATTKKANPNGFKVGGTIWYCNTNYNANTNIGGYAVVYSSISIFDSRYALNTSLVANSLTPYKPIYLVGTINNSNNLFYLDSVWWTQEPNDTSKVYVLIGACYDSTTSYCRITLYEQNIWYYYDGEKLCEYIYHAQNANNAITVNGHSVEKDVPSDAVFTDTNTTYSMTRSGASITLTPSSGTAQSITESSLLSALSSGTGDVTDSTLFITSHANGESGSTSYYKRAATTLFNYLKTKFGTAAQKNVPTSGNASTSQVVMGNDTRLSDARPASDVSAWAKASTKPTYTASEVGAIATSAKGANGGVAELGSDGKVPSSQLPSYVDDVLEYTNKASFPSTGESGKIYVDLATNLTYRWSGTAYTEISPSLALGETSSTAYRGDHGKTAYTHATDSSRLTTAKTSGLYKIATTAEGHVASVTAVTKADITGLGIPGSDTNTTYTFAEGTANGKFQVTPSGGTAQSVAVHGLNDLAYKSSASATYTPAGNCTGGNVTLNTTTVPNVTGVGSLPTCTFPELSLSVNSNKRLIISHTEGSFSQGSLPTLGTAITVATSVKSVTQPTFGGTQATITVN